MAGPYKIQLTGVARLSPKFKNLDFIEASFRNKAQKIEEQAKTRVKAAVEQAISGSLVFKCLTNPPLGVRGYDLPAEFGLTDAEASSAAYQMKDILVETATNVYLDAFLRKNKTVQPSVELRIRGYYLHPKKYTRPLTASPFYYDSKKARIAWMRWILDAGRGNNAIYDLVHSITDYGISYDLDARILRRYSRSGRALMLQNTLANRKRLQIRYFPYELPAAIRPTRGRNFIDAIARDTGFSKKITGIVKSVLDNNIKG